MKIDDVLTALHRISLASQNSMSSKEECGRIARIALFEWNRAEKEARVEPDEEPEVVSYTRHGLSAIESHNRAALHSRYSEMWHLYTKNRRAKRAEIGEWEPLDLIPAQKGTTSEARATKWVVDGVWKP